MANKNTTILVIEDESAISNFISTVLGANEYKVLRAEKGREGLSLLSSHCPDLVLLDLGLPDMDGLDVLRSIRQWSKIPIIVVSARGHEREKVLALDAGADDYITKPFGTSELLARIRTALRHRAAAHPENDRVTGTFTTGGLSIDFDRRLVAVDGQDIHLTQIEFKIITLVSKHAGRVLTYDYIIKNIWGPYAAKDNQILRVNMANIRRKIEKNPAEPRYILTEVDVGYRMAEDA